MSHRFFSTFRKRNDDQFFRLVSISIITVFLFGIVSISDHVFMAQTALLPQEQQFDLGLYNNSTYGLSFMYPVDWYKAEILTGPIIDIKFVVPSNSSSLFDIPTIDVFIDKSLGNTSSLEEYDALQEQTFSTLFNNATVLVNRSTMLSDLPALERAFVTNQSGAPSASVQMFTVKDGKVFAITFVADQSEFLRYLPVFTRLTESFTLTHETPMNAMR
jgi:hypothetical protein